MRLPVVLVGAAAMLGAAPLHAIPAFARQTGFPCAQCHTQHFPTLNEFGRNFKLNGYTLVGGATPLVQGSRLSLPAGLNAALFTKVRYQKTSGTDAAGARSTNSGEIQFPDEFALFLAGRISPNIGFFLEGQLPEGDVPLLAGFKMPFSYTVGPVRASVIPFTTDGLGPAYGFELLSTGAVDNIRFMEHSPEFSAQQYIGTATEASGAAFVVGNAKFFTNVTIWSPVHLATSAGRASPLPRSGYLRAAVTPHVGQWSLGMGGQLWLGSSRVDDGSGNGTVTTVADKAWALDGQAHGQVGTYPLGLYASYARAAGTDPGDDPNIYNAGSRDRSALAVAAELGVLPGRGSLLAAYRLGDNGAPSSHTDRALTVGGIYHLYQNVQFQVDWTFRSGNAYSPAPPDGKRLLTVMMAAGF